MKPYERVSAVYQPADVPNSPAVYAPFVGMRGHFIAGQQDPITKAWSMWPETFDKAWSGVRVPHTDLANIRTIHPTPNGLKPMRQRT